MGRGQKKREGGGDNFSLLLSSPLSLFFGPRPTFRALSGFHSRRSPRVKEETTRSLRLEGSELLTSEFRTLLTRLACVASVSVGFQSREKPKNEILIIFPRKKWERVKNGARGEGGRNYGTHLHHHHFVYFDRILIGYL